MAEEKQSLPTPFEAEAQISAIHPKSAADWMALGDILIKSGAVGACYKAPGNVVAAVLTGLELGIKPMQALRMLYIVNNKVAVPGELMSALFMNKGGEIEWIETDATKATVKLISGGKKLQHTFTMEDANKARLGYDQSGKRSDKSPWTTYPRAMLRMACLREAIRMIRPDIAAGIDTPDELGARVDHMGRPILDKSGDVVMEPNRGEEDSAPTTKEPAREFSEAKLKEYAEASGRLTELLHPRSDSLQPAELSKMKKEVGASWVKRILDGKQPANDADLDRVLLVMRDEIARLELKAADGFPDPNLKAVSK